MMLKGVEMNVWDFFCILRADIRNAPHLELKQAVTSVEMNPFSTFEDLMRAKGING